MAFTIYMVEAPDGRCYVGCTKRTIEERWRQHEKGGREWPGDGRALLSDAISRFGRESFKLRTLATAERLEDAAAIETLMIERHNTAQPHGYNFMRTSHYSPRRWKWAA